MQRFLAEKRESDDAGNDDFYNKYGLSKKAMASDIPTSPDPIAEHVA